MTSTTPAKAQPSCWRHLMGGIQTLAFFGVILVAAGAVGWILLQRHLDGEIRRTIEQRLAASFVDSPLEITVREARRVDAPDVRQQGIEVRGVEIRDRRTDQVVVAIDELWLACCCDLTYLLNEQIEVRHMTVRRPRVRLRGGPEALAEWKRWWKPPPHANSEKASLSVEEGAIDWLVDPNRPESLVSLRGLDLLARRASQETLDKLEWQTDSSSDAESAAKVTHMRITAGGELLSKLAVDVLWSGEEQRWLVRGETEGVRVARELLGVLPAEWSSAAQLLRTLDARGALTLVASSPPTPDAPPSFSVEGRLREGRWSDPRIPAPLTDLDLDFRADSNGLEVQRAEARCGGAELGGTFSMHGWDWDGACAASVRMRHFVVTRAWLDLLPDEWRSQWDKYGVLGEFDADLTATYDGRHWRPEGSLVGRDMTMRVAKFPYPLAHGSGRVEFRDGVAVSRDVVFLTHERPIQFEFELAGSGPQKTGFVQMKALQGIPIDDAFLDALEGPTATFFRSLQPRGEVAVDGRLERQSLDAPWQRSLELDFRRCSIQYSKFAYPIEKVQGKVKLAGDVWTIGELSGRNDSAYLVARGMWSSQPPTLQLDVEAYDVPLEEELRSALTPGLQKLWAQLQPRGTIDYVAIGLRLPNAAGKLGVDVAVQKNPPSQNVEGRNLTLRPQSFPYSLDNLVGGLRFVDGAFEFEGVRAEHARTVFRAKGRGRVEADGAWQVEMTDFAADRLQLDHDLLTALPASASNSLGKLNWSGPIYVDGRLAARGASQSADQTRLDWDLRMDVENGSCQATTPVEQIRGSSHWIGAWQGGAWESEVDLQIDSAFVRGVHVTQIQGPLRLRPGQVVLGDAWANVRRPDRPPRQVTAQLFGGAAAADAIVNLGEELTFRMQAGLQNMSLKELSREASSSGRDLSGRAFASLQLEGTSRGVHTWRGLGKVTVRDTNIEEIPFLVSVLKGRSQRRTDAMLALSDVDFSVQGDRIYFQRIDLKGEGLTLKGRGEMNLDRIVDLQFYTIMGRDDFWVPVVTPVLAEASKQMFEIRVTGPLESPVVDRKVVPAINDALEQMFPEMAARTAETPLINRVPTPRQFFQRRPAP
ncbi:MAG: hypothetical protein U0939_26810 [Pirellulales bacterium]